ncbi:MAG: T9SS type A sorting domain-containing protein [Bacteroidetes bacterium]|nr:T9SS type A sorting domain-containing protein [Bacteroidota bacterium]
MKKLTYFFKLFLLLLFIPVILTAQRNNIWCFGDSAAIDFGSGIPVAGISAMNSRGTCVSVSDTNSNLLFYGNTRSGAGGVTSGLLWNKNNLLMLEGDSISGGGWYHELVIVPNPVDDSMYYVFSIGVTISFGLKYSTVDMRGDNGLGEVIQKNVSLLSNIRMVDCLTAIKHGNGRDWWVIARPSPVQQPAYNNSWYSYLISPSGISMVNIQNVGSLNGTNIGNITFYSDSSKLVFTNLGGMIELYDFDRCSGIISNPVNIEPQIPIQPNPMYWSSEFSSSGRYLYVSASTTPSKLWQFDTWASNIDSTKTLIWQTYYPPFTAGALKRAPNNKIYMSCAWSDSSGNFNYPYDSTMYYTENMNLSVINLPDSSGLACDFQPWSFYLGGKRTYWGLPNNPDYDLPALAGSPCDTLVGITEQPSTNNTTAELFIYYHTGWQTAFINAQKLTGHNYRLRVYDIQGKEILSESDKLNPPYYTKNLNCTSFAKGLYVVVLETDKEKLTKKFVIE